MKDTAKLLAIALIATGLAIAAGPATAQDAASQIKTRIGGLQQSLKDKPISDPDLAPVNSMVGDALKAASEALSAGRVYLSLEKLADVSNLLEGARTAQDKAAVVKGGLTVFESQWGEASLKLTAVDQQAQTRGWDHSSAAIRGLSEAAQGRSLPLLEGGRGFATATEPKDGLFYLGEAQGEAEFAQFCASLNLPAKATPFPLRSLLPELQRLQEKTNAAFQPPRSIELHSRFIALNSTLKLAHELDARRFYAGALYQYLEAVRHYGMLDAAPLDAARQTALKEAIAAAQRKLAASTRDDSIAQLFLERAASQVAHADGSAPSADEWRSAQVIVDQVLPAYFAAEKPVSPLQTPFGKTVDITLVRWPYT
jgi:hypothetical protein